MEYEIVMLGQLSLLLRNLRKQAGLTQMDLGERLGISQRMISKIETNPEKVSFVRIRQILNALDADLIIRERESLDDESW